MSNHVMISARRLLNAVLALVVLAGFAKAAPRDEVLGLVPEDVAFCLVVQDLRGQLNALLESPFAEKVAASPLGRAVRNAPETQKLADVEKLLRDHLNIRWSQLRDEILGDAVVLAYRPSPTGKPEQDHGLLLVRARNPEMLAALVERLNQVQKQSGELKELQTRKHEGVAYYCRVASHGEQFYYLRGPVFAFSSQEGMLRQVIEREQQQTKTEPFVARQLKRLGAEGALAALWINPRAFDAELAQKVAHTRGAEAVVHRKLLDYWKALDGIALSLTLQTHALELSLSLAARDGELSPAAKKFFAADSKPSELWDRFPENALLALAGRVDAVALTELLAEFIPAEAQRGLRETLDRHVGAALGLNVSQELLPNLGPDWGFCIVAPTGADKALLPHALAALRVKPGSKEKPVDRALLGGLNSLAVLAVLGYNSSRPDPLALKTEQQEKVEVKYFTSDKEFPPSVKPAFALKEGYLVLASSPEAIRGFAVGSRSSAATATEGLLVRVSLREWGNYLKERREALAAHVAEKHQLSRDEAGRRLQGLHVFCQLVERLELLQRSGDGRVSLVLRVRTEQPLRK